MNQDLPSLDFTGGGVIAADPMMSLADAAVTASGALNAGAVREIVFLRMYLGPYGVDLTQYLISLKLRQSPGALKRLVDIVNAFALNKLWQRININVGGK